MNHVPPWAQGPFELIVHAEEHMKRGEDFDRRIALISFDNAVEVAISTYLSLNPIQRGGRQYPKEEVEKWLLNYHTKLGFFESELTIRKLAWVVDKSHIIWAHDNRNEQYHGGSKGTPEKQVLKIIREAAIWILSVLYEIPDVEKILEDTISLRTPPLPAKPNINLNRAIDDVHGMVEIAGQLYYTSEVLFAVDETAYREIGENLIIETPEDV